MSREEEIRRVAYGLWEKEGRPEGRDMELWLRAEVIWESERRKPADRSRGTSTDASRPTSDQPRTSTEAPRSASEQSRSESRRSGTYSSSNRPRDVEEAERT